MCPIATTDESDVERKELKTAPPDGYVVLRPMPFGVRNKRDQMMTTLKVMARQRGRQQRQGTDDIFGILESANDKVTAFEFRTCIVEHNLTDKEGRPLNFNNQQDIDRLSPKIGGEIKEYIDEMNGLGDFSEEDEEGGLGNSSNGSGTESLEEKLVTT